MNPSKNLDYRAVLKLDTRDPLTTDETYIKAWGTITDHPLFISYPRTGAHWINAVIELYFDRPRLPEVRATFLDPERDDWAWYHDHDTIAFSELLIKNHSNKGVLYLYRNPVDTLYSWIIYQYNQGVSLNFLPPKRLRELVVATSEQYRDHLTKWLLNSKDTTVVPIRYEDFVKDPVTAFGGIMKYWEKENLVLDEERVEACFAVANPKALSARRTEWSTLSDFMLTDVYKQERAKFREEFEAIINSIVITEDLKEYFV